MSDEERSNEVWNRLRAWFQSHYPAFLEGLNPGLDANAVAESLATTGRAMPNSLAALYGVQDGQQDLDDGLLLGWRFLPLAQVVDAWRELERESADRAIDSGVWSGNWLPFARSLTGDYYCAVCEPDSGAGQVVRVWHDSIERSVVANSAIDLFEKVADELESGRWAYSEADGFSESGALGLRPEGGR